ncbi:MAG TPA: putative sulfate exporter family transporter [Xanthobacteraceae bacterium]|nr:putative sulfate exporter family transporter [Xanthobacteraceae bacterium]
MFAVLQRTLPGLALCVAITALAKLAEQAEVGLTGYPYLEGLIIAILLGVLIRTFWTPGPAWRGGIGFSAKTLLEIAVVLLGASLSAGTVLALGAFLLIGIALIVAVAIASSYLISRALGLPPKMSILVACGNSICGNSAIAAVAPIIDATSEDVASSIAFTAVLGVVVVLTLPLLVPLLSLSLTQYGVLAGLTVYAVPQVLAATLPIGALSNQVGTVVKLVRVLMLGPVVFALSLFAARLRGSAPGSGVKRWPALHELVPWFIVGFLLLALARSLSLIPASLVEPVRTVASVLTTIAMAALGLGVDLRTVAKAGARVTAAVTISLIVLGVISFVLIRLAGIG